MKLKSPVLWSFLTLFSVSACSYNDSVPPLNKGYQRTEACQAELGAHRKIYEQQKADIYANLKRYGVNPDDLVALGKIGSGGKKNRLENLSKNMHYGERILSSEILTRGDYYRFELDEFRLSIKVPDVDPEFGNLSFIKLVGAISVT